MEDEILEAMGAWARLEMQENTPGSVQRIRGAALLGLIAEYGELQEEVERLRAIEKAARELVDLADDDAPHMDYFTGDMECDSCAAFARLQAALILPADLERRIDHA